MSARIGTIVYKDTPDARQRFAELGLDTNYEDTFSITLNGTDTNGQHVTARYVQIDNFENIAPVQVTINGIRNTVAPYTRTTFEIASYTPEIGIFAYEGTVKVYISEAKLGIGDGTNDLAKDNAFNMGTYLPLAGGAAMLADFDAGGFLIRNVKSPVVASDAVNLDFARKMRSYPTLKELGLKLDGSDETDAFQAILDGLDVSGGKSAVVFGNPGILGLYKAVKWPSRVFLIGASRRAFIVRFQTAAATIQFYNIDNCGVKNIRFDCNDLNDILFLDVYASTTSVFNWFMDDCEIIGTTKTGQMGLRWRAVAPNILTECRVFGTKWGTIDKPIYTRDDEGNRFVACEVDNWGYSANPICLDFQGLANKYDFRISGAPVATFTGMRNTGARCQTQLIVDCGVNGKALDIPGEGHQILLQRPERKTPLGTWADRNFVVDDADVYCGRLGTKGQPSNIANFSLSAGWGANATVTNVKGTDNRVAFTVNAAGAGIAANPTISYAFAGGNWDKNSSVVQITRDGGNQNGINAGGGGVGPASWGATFFGTPVAGESYAFIATIS